MVPFDPEALIRLVRRTFGHAPTSVVAMPGGASTRRYFRVSTKEQSVVAMFVPDAARPEEVSQEQVVTRWPFLEVGELLRGRGIRVPHVWGEACEEGLILIEDLGDETMDVWVKKAPERRDEIYKTAVRDLGRAQRALEHLPETCVIRTRQFDETLLLWELDHFREWGLDARDRALTPEDRAEFDAIALRLARRIADWPRGFVHRDYQSRNLMGLESKRKGGKIQLAWIDFQDALLGPRVYDLVALLNDSYQDIDYEFLSARLDDFASEQDMDRAEREKLGREFDVVTVQRKLKDAGRFVFIDRMKQNPSFLPYVEPTLAKVRAALDRLSDEEDMRAMVRFVERAM